AERLVGIGDHQHARETLLDQSLSGRGSRSRSEFDDDRGHLPGMPADRLRRRQWYEGTGVLLGDAEVVDTGDPHVALANFECVADANVQLRRELVADHDLI